MSYSLKTTFWAAGQTTKQQILGPRCRNNVFSDNATSKYCLTIPHDASLFSLKERLRFSTAFFREKILPYKKLFFVKRHLYKKEGLSLIKRKLPNGAELWLLKCWQQKSTRYSIEKKSGSVFKFLNNFRPFTRPIEK